MEIIKNIDNAVVAFKTTQSPIEQKMAWMFMRCNRFIYSPDDICVGAGWFVIPQYKVGNYRADFVIKAYGFHPLHNVWPPKHLTTVAIECDGKEFHQDKEYDRLRDEYFKSQGVDTLRFSGSEIHNISHICLEHIISYIEGKA